MAVPAPTYDLVLLLDPQAEDAARTKIVAGVRDAISAQGELLRHDEWGERPLAYPIRRKGSAEYHLMQFHSSTPELIAGLNRTLHITDGIMRYRINKLKPGTPAAPDMRTQRGFASEHPSEPQPAEQQPAAAQPAQRQTEAEQPATEQPAAATEQQRAATEQPAAATEQPAAATEQPAAATEQQRAQQRPGAEPAPQQQPAVEQPAAE
jgi:small subunit ribosomal protein S6